MKTINKILSLYEAFWKKIIPREEIVGGVFYLIVFGVIIASFISIFINGVTCQAGL